MKKVLFLVCVVLTVLLASCGYSKEDLIRAENMGYRSGFEEGYDLAKYEASGELERYDHYMDNAYETGYEVGYDDGYDDCMLEHGLTSPTLAPEDRPRIEKDRD